MGQGGRRLRLPSSFFECVWLYFAQTEKTLAELVFWCLHPLRRTRAQQSRLDIVHATATEISSALSFSLLMAGSGEAADPNPLVRRLRDTLIYE